MLEAVSILLGQYSGKKNDWASIRKILNQDLVANILNFDKDHVPHKSLQMIAPLTANGEFEYENVAPVSSACTRIAQWVLAIENYARNNNTTQYSAVNIQLDEPSRAFLPKKKTKLSNQVGYITSSPRSPKRNSIMHSKLNTSKYSNIYHDHTI